MKIAIGDATKLAKELFLFFQEFPSSSCNNAYRLHCRIFQTRVLNNSIRKLALWLRRTLLQIHSRRIFSSLFSGKGIGRNEMPAVLITSAFVGISRLRTEGKAKECTETHCSAAWWRGNAVAADAVVARTRGWEWAPVMRPWCNPPDLQVFDKAVECHRPPRNRRCPCCWSSVSHCDRTCQEFFSPSTGWSDRSRNAGPICRFADSVVTADSSACRRSCCSFRNRTSGSCS